MTANSVVRARIDQRIKEEAAAALAAMGLTHGHAKEDYRAIGTSTAMRSFVCADRMNRIPRK